MAGYHEFAPRPGLGEVVACTWTRTAPASVIGEQLRILPDGCIDLIWSGGELLVASPDRVVRQHRVHHAGEYVGVRLLPGTGGALIGWAADDLPAGTTPLEAIWGAAARPLAEQLGAAGDARERRLLLQDALLERLHGSAQLDALVLRAVALLDGPRGRVGDLPESLSLGSRQLQRRFREQVGYGPKLLARVLRFRRLLVRVERATAAGREVALASLAWDLGYADQAHLARECRALSGLTARELAGWAATG